MANTLKQVELLLERLEQQIDRLSELPTFFNTNVLAPVAYRRATLLVLRHTGPGRRHRRYQPGWPSTKRSRSRIGAIDSEPTPGPSCFTPTHIHMKSEDANALKCWRWTHACFMLWRFSQTRDRESDAGGAADV